MQRDVIMWTTDVRGGVSRPRRLSEGPDPCRRAQPRCLRCDIPLGPQRCPNPDCRAPHGQGVGVLCTWCHDHPGDRLETRDRPSRSHIEGVVMQGAATQRRAGAGGRGGRRGTASRHAGGHRSCV